MNGIKGIIEEADLLSDELARDDITWDEFDARMKSLTELARDLLNSPNLSSSEVWKKIYETS